ncbi:hypothetical protein J6590_072527, partial [Homalodisca vitripennis]
MMPARLAQLNKGRSPSHDTLPFRPLCMLDMTVKDLLKPGLQSIIRASGNLSEHQHSSCEGYSAMSDITEKVEAIRRAGMSSCGKSIGAACDASPSPFYMISNWHEAGKAVGPKRLDQYRYLVEREFESPTPPQWRVQPAGHRTGESSQR